MDTLDKRLAVYDDYFPLCMDYSELLYRIMKKEKISLNIARKKYRLFTYKQWREVL